MYLLLGFELQRHAAIQTLKVDTYKINYYIYVSAFRVRIAAPRCRQRHAEIMYSIGPLRGLNHVIINNVCELWYLVSERAEPCND